MRPDTIRILISAWPGYVGSLFAFAQWVGLRWGHRWAYHCGFQMGSYQETLPLRIPDVLPDANDDSTVVNRFGPQHLGFVRRSQFPRRGRVGYVTYGIIDIVRSASQTTFRYRRFVPLWLPAMALFSSLQAITMGAGWRLSLAMLALCVVFFLAVVADSFGRLRTSYELLSADLAKQGAPPTPPDAAGHAAAHDEVAETVGPHLTSHHV